MSSEDREFDRAMERAQRAYDNQTPEDNEEEDFCEEDIDCMDCQEYGNCERRKS